MYDPTIFENLKVALENRVYDLDNLDQKISIINRTDRMDLATMARDFSIQFTLRESSSVEAEIVLLAPLQDLAGEILELPWPDLGCSLLLRFVKPVQNYRTQCRQIEDALHAIWEDDILITQTLSFRYGPESVPDYVDLIEVKFRPKLNEGHMGELSDFLGHVLNTLTVLLKI